MSRAINQTTVLISGTVKAETGKAILVIISGVNDVVLDTPVTVWFPFSQVSNIMREPEKPTKLRVKEWIVMKTPSLAAALENNELSVPAVDAETGELSGYAEFKARMASKGTGGKRTREDDEDYDDIPY